MTTRQTIRQSIYSLKLQGRTIQKQPRSFLLRGSFYDSTTGICNPLESGKKVSIYYEGRMVEETLNNLICLGKAGKVKQYSYPPSLTELVKVVERHARKDLNQALPWLPNSQEEWKVSEVWDKVLHTDILVNRAGWVVAIDWTINPVEVTNKLRKLERVTTALSRFGIDRAVLVLVHQLEDAPTVSWQAQLDAIIKATCQEDSFVSDGELYF